MNKPENFEVTSRTDMVEMVSEMQNRHQEQHRAIIYESSLALSGIICLLAMRENELVDVKDGERSTAELIGAATKIVDQLNLDKIVSLRTPVDLSAQLEEGEILRAARRSRKLTQMDMAQMIGVDRFTIMRIEQGKTDNQEVREKIRELLLPSEDTPEQDTENT